MSFFSDFKAFLLKKDIVALATAVIIGAAFNKVISSVVADIFMPIIGLLTGGADLTQQFISLDGVEYESLEAAIEAEAAILTYGNLIQAIIYFIIVGLFIFIFLRAYEKTKKKEEAAAPAGPSKEEVLLTEIRDELRKKNI
ncbi:large conductance mechanosensitive channel protein MscL [Christiangramia sp. OXR-203]|jgi:large conductance mechanosensitive channel|uniref:large conductance mechanosensitive channel protein MscL n=1 Tax=Christiangramia sp. OXR-203 TaxID=3100176 RepID=UPI002AC9ED32|nr:large conductance mechanosensitive channel protein MscL [Christiangramia sp. OXR-203]WPY98651.1 large conductance mechanosensitive channel protein MscL [Christiangramia sp. OXR-203]